MSEIKVVVRMNEEQKAYCVGKAREVGVSVQQWALCKLMEDSVIPVVPEKEVFYGLKANQDKVSGKGVGGKGRAKKDVPAGKERIVETIKQSCEAFKKVGEEILKESLEENSHQQITPVPDSPEYLTAEHLVTVFSEIEKKNLAEGIKSAVDQMGEKMEQREAEKAEQFAGAYGPEKRVSIEPAPVIAKPSFAEPEPFPGTKYVPVGQDKFVPTPVKVDAYMPVKQVVSRPVALQTDCYLKEEAGSVDKKIAMPNGVKTGSELDSF